MNEFSVQMPMYQKILGDKFVLVSEKLALLDIKIDRQQLLSYLDPGIAMGVVSNLLSGVDGVMTNFILALLTVVFMLFEADIFPRKVHIALDDPFMIIQHIDRFLKSVKNYLAIKTGVSLGTGVLAGLLLYFLGGDHYMLWATTAFLLNYVPNIGSIIAALLPVLFALVQIGPITAGFVGLGFFTINIVIGNVIEPRHMGRGRELLSVPLTMIVKIALESNEDTRWLALPLGSEDAAEVTKKLTCTSEDVQI